MRAYDKLMDINQQAHIAHALPLPPHQWDDNSKKLSKFSSLLKQFPKSIISDIQTHWISDRQ